MRLKKAFAVFFTFCLIFSASLLPVSASEISDLFLPHAVNASDSSFSGLTYPFTDFDTGYLVADYTTSPMGANGIGNADYMSTDGFVYLTPVVGSRYAPATTIANSTYQNYYWFPDFSFVPEAGAIDQPMSLYISFGVVSTQYCESWYTNNAWHTTFFDHSSGRREVDNTSEMQFNTLLHYRPGPNPETNGGDPWPYYSNQLAARIDCNFTIYDAAMQINFWSDDYGYTFVLPASSNVSLGYYIPYCYLVPTTSYLDIFDEIYMQLVSIDNRLATQLPQIYAGLQNIVTQLENLNTDTDTIIEILNQIKNLDESQLSVLNYILTTTQSLDTTVKQIYALMLSEVSGSDDLSEDAASASGSINNNDVQEIHWQTSMSYNFDQLQLGNYNLNLLGGGLALVGNMFSSIWSAFGQWSIVFTFPLILGIALLVIGRLSKTGGGNSSRNSEHKGGEGGA